MNRNINIANLNRCSNFDRNIGDRIADYKSPIFGYDGTYRGCTKEGYTGVVIFYDGNKDFKNMTSDQLMLNPLNGADTYDNMKGFIDGEIKSKVWTHIASQMEGKKIYDETFNMSNLEGGKIHFVPTTASWESTYVRGTGKGLITGSDGYTYSTTVENIQSSIVIHEYYSHIRKNNGSFIFASHRLAYKNVINFKSLWNKTTDGYKGFNMRRLLDYTKLESNNTKTQVDPLYRNLFKKYKNIYD